jgi:arabinofuranan 3-O-arabinosyltransferase
VVSPSIGRMATAARRVGGEALAAAPSETEAPSGAEAATSEQPWQRRRRRVAQWWRQGSVRATAAVLAGLTVLSFVQRPGRITFDTKLDLVLAPAAFLNRSLHLWNPEATFGELQNQAYGYLFPVGPFFVVTEALGVPTWVAQRLWCALLLGGAFLGAFLLARALRIGSEPARYIGAVSYALAPRMLTEIGPVSVEMLPAVLLPWVLLPLVRVDRFGPRRAALLSGVAVLCMGGVNASMVLMALTLPGIWLLTRHWTLAHVRLVAWWFVAVLAATLWWIVPLLQLAGYSLPFLNYIESAANTTAPLSLFQVLRGTNQWVAYVVQGEPWWPAGFMLVDNPVLMVATTLVAGLGLVGLVRRGLPERTFLLLGTLAGLLLLTLGHVGPLGSPFAMPWQHLLDGPLAPFRNVHKFDPVLRLTLTMGFVHLASRPLFSGMSHRARTGWQPLVAAALVLVVATPAFALTLRPGKGWTEVPAYWHEAAQWLGNRDATARTLMVPATGFGEYRWGRTVDEPLQALARAPWAVRSQTPLGSEGNTRFMDTVSDALSGGRGSPALADYLARAGVRFLLLRNDLDTTAALDLPPTAVLRQALRRSPGITLARTFGPAAPLDVASPVDAGRDYPALEVYEVDRPVRLASVAPIADGVTVSGGPESVLPMLEQGVLRPDQPTVLAGDLPAGAQTAGGWVVTDGLRRRERNVGRVQGNLSQTLADTDPIRHDRPTLDLLPVDGAQHLTVAQYQGVRSVVASTSGGYADAFGSTDPSQLPFAAVDGDPQSYWRSSSFTGPVGEWLEVTLDTPRVFDTVTIDFPQDLRVGWPVARIRITTDRGSVDRDVPESPGPHEYGVNAGPSAKLRVTVLAMRGGRTDGNVAISELTIPGVVASRMLRAPADVPDAARPPVFAFSRGTQPRAACVTDEVTRCDAALARVGEEPLGVDRRLRLSTPGLYGITASALPRLGAIPWTSPAGLTATPSSQLGGDPAVAVRAAFDGRPGTSWVADPADQNPTIELRWTGARTLDSLSFDRSTLDAANAPLSVQLRAGDQVRNVTLRDGGTSASFEPLTSDNVRITLRSADRLAFGGSAGQNPSGLGVAVGVGELRIPALADLLTGAAEELGGAACGLGPPLEVDGKRYDTQVFGSTSGTAEFRQLQVLPCGKLADEGLPLGAGEHRVRALPTAEFVVQDLTLRPLATPPPTIRGRTLDVVHWEPALRRVQVGDGPESYLTVPENANAGWVATLEGRTLARARVDGWQQAWVLPAGAHGTVELRFVPDHTYRTGLALGGAAAAALLLAALLPLLRRRRGVKDVPLDAEVDDEVVAETARGWWVIALVVVAMFFALGGPAAIVVLLGCLMLRRLWPRALPVVAALGVLAAAAVAVTGRLTGHGQDWAFGLWPQLTLLIAIAAVIAAFLYPATDGPAEDG